ncbi:MAG: hypothetical protein AAGF12_06560 [Myxococcota bacterium]
MGTPRKRSNRLLVVLTLVAAPGALAVESLLRWLLFPEDFEILRTYLEPFVTPIAWLMAALTAILGLVGLRLQRTMSAKKIARLPEERRTEAQLRRTRTGVFLLTASVPQIPAVIATVLFMIGSSLWPVIVALVVVTVAVGAQAYRLR